MPRPSSDNLRLRVVPAVDSGQTTREVGALFAVSPGFVSRVHQRWRHTGGVHSQPIGGYRRALLEACAEVLREPLSKSPSITGKARQSRLASAQSLPISILAIAPFLRQKRGYRYKKTGVATEPPREEVAAHEHWPAWQQQGGLSKRVVLDETGGSLDLNPIEPVLAQLKALLRQAAERRDDQLWRSLGAILDQVQADEGRHFFKHSGYAFN
jgi:transposase